MAFDQRFRARQEVTIMTPGRSWSRPDSKAPSIRRRLELCRRVTNSLLTCYAVKAGVREASCLSGPVDVGSMLDAHDTDDPGRVVRLVDDPVRASSSRTVSLDLSLQGLADELGRVEQGADHELDDRGRDPLR